MNYYHSTDTSTSHITIVCSQGEPMILSTIDTRSTSSNSTTVSNVSQCSNYTLDTDASRLATYSATTSSCDSTVYATPLWVRFTGGGATTLATSATLSYRCGTYYTGWLVSSLPSTS
ncbi:unnamed protein product, partial [Rotaria magnacalcarata]